MFISKEASIILDKIIAKAKGEGYVKIDNAKGSFMPVSFEYLGEVEIPTLGTCKHYSIAHYYEQNGDLMADPEMCVLELSTGHRIAYYYKQDNLAIEITALSFKTGCRIAKLINEGNWFFNIWMNNILHQQQL